MAAKAWASRGAGRTMTVLAAAVVVLLAAARVASQACVAVDPENPDDFVYDLTPLTNNTDDYTAMFELVALYTFQFCRALVKPISPTTCPITETMVCERYLNTYRSVGNRPSTISVIEPGHVRISYTRGAPTAPGARPPRAHPG